VAARLADSYQHCRALHRRYGRTYYLATRLLPAWKRRHVHALYGFTRYADEIVDAPDGGTPGQRADRLRIWGTRFLEGLHDPGTAGVGDDPILPAVLHTIEVFDLDRSDFEKFLHSMRMDLTVVRYASYDDLLEYMEGSAAVIGTMMLPVLGTADRAAAREPARQLGLAFQLTNFIRDVREDLDRGRIYLPLADLAGAGLGEAELIAAAAAGTATAPVRALIRREVDRARDHYRRAAPGIALLEPGSQACIRAAYRLYGAILDEVVGQGHDVLQRRATVPNRRRLAVAAGCVLSRPGRPVPLPAGG